jgi:ribonuclease R
MLFTNEASDKDVFDAICATASEKERLSAKAENSVMLLKKLRLLSSMIEETKGRQFDCVVTRVKPFGIYFDAIELMLEGFLHVSELENDYFVYDERKMRLIGSKNDITYLAGDVLCVMVKKIDFILKEASWQIVGSKKSFSDSPPKQDFGKRKKKKFGKKRR